MKVFEIVNIIFSQIVKYWLIFQVVTYIYKTSTIIKDSSAL